MAPAASLRGGRRVSMAVWCAGLVLLAALGVGAAAAAATAASSSATAAMRKYNKTCRYAARNISAALFKSGVAGGYDGWLCPLESILVVMEYAEQPWRACFGDGERVDARLIAQGKKLPCFYRTSADGRSVDYWEENACDVLLRSNCYCFAVGAFVGSYCEPGLASTGKALPMPITSCDAVVAGAVADGARPVGREEVYGAAPPPAGTHYVSLAVRPSRGPTDTGDYHWWRLDRGDGGSDNSTSGTSGMTWAYKAGDTLARNTFRNGTLLRDAGAADARGAYTEHCGYFLIDPRTHRVAGNGYFFSALPRRAAAWRANALAGSVVQLSAISPGWVAAYHAYYADAGWEDGLLPDAAAVAAAKERGSSGGGGGFARPPHTSSMRPFDWDVTAATAAAAGGNVAGSGARKLMI